MRSLPEREETPMHHARLVRVAVLATAGLLGGTLAFSGAKDEPQRIVVQHILIGFKRSVPGKKIERTREQAKALGEELLRRARAGEDFGALVEKYTDDKPPGKYMLTNSGAPEVSGGRRREEMVPRFGDVAFGLAVSEIGLAAYSAGMSPYGYHVIKRLE
jgi:hypothetical protein